jgi:hypothetical protein
MRPVLAGGVDPQTAARAIDALTLYVNAYCLETSLRGNQATRHGDSWVASGVTAITVRANQPR